MEGKGDARLPSSHQVPTQLCGCLSSVCKRSLHALTSLLKVDTPHSTVTILQGSAIGRCDRCQKHDSASQHQRSHIPAAASCIEGASQLSIVVHKGRCIDLHVWRVAIPDATTRPCMAPSSQVCSNQAPLFNTRDEDLHLFLLHGKPYRVGGWTTLL